MAWFSTDRPPRISVSVPTSPLAPLPSPYEICQVLPVDFLKVELFLGSKIVWAEAEVEDLMEEGSSVLQTQRSAEPVSKSSFRFWGGVPMLTVAR
jgi:hypothetical protein